eukprot:jgi/Bigna1/141423/aug1.62_g16131
MSADVIGKSGGLLVTFSDRKTPLRMTKASIKVFVNGMHIEVRQRLTFFNPHNKALEGELVLPLPERATICRFGKIDPETNKTNWATVVTKEKARVVFETEVRTGKKAAMVEKIESAGNLYKTRIYPIPPQCELTVELWHFDSLDYGQVASSSISSSKAEDNGYCSLSRRRRPNGTAVAAAATAATAAATTTTTTTTTMASWFNLPDSLVGHIACFLGPKSISRLSCVNKRVLKVMSPALIRLPLYCAGLAQSVEVTVIAGSVGGIGDEEIYALKAGSASTSCLPLIRSDDAKKQLFCSVKKPGAAACIGVAVPFLVGNQALVNVQRLEQSDSDDDSEAVAAVAKAATEGKVAPETMTAAVNGNKRGHNRELEMVVDDNDEDQKKGLGRGEEEEEEDDDDDDEREEEETYFSILDRPLSVHYAPERSSSSNSSIGIIWDTSLSRDIDSESEKALLLERRVLEAFLLKNTSSSTKMSLYSFSTAVTPCEGVQGVDTKTLLQAVDALRYRGATKMEALATVLMNEETNGDCDGRAEMSATTTTTTTTTMATDHDFWVIFTDGVDTLELLPDAMAPTATADPTPAKPCYILTASSTADRAYLRALALRSGGRFFDLLKAREVARAPQLIGQAWFGFLGAAYDARQISSLHPSGARPMALNERLAVTGKLASGTKATSVVLHYGVYGLEPVLSRRITIVASSPSSERRRRGGARGGRGTNVARAWAADEVRRIEGGGALPERYAKMGVEKGKKRIFIDLGRKFKIVTPGTSMIMLEKLSQFIQHDVTPPTSSAFYKEFIQKQRAGTEAEEAQVHFLMG